MQAEDTQNKQEELSAPELNIPISDVEESTLSAMKNIYNNFQDELYTLEEEAKRQGAHGRNQ